MASATALGLGGVDTRTICSCRGLVEKARLGIEERADVFEGNAIIGRLHFTKRAPRPEPSFFTEVSWSDECRVRVVPARPSGVPFASPLRPAPAPGPRSRTARHGRVARATTLD